MKKNTSTKDDVHINPSIVCDNPSFSKCSDIWWQVQRNEELEKRGTSQQGFKNDNQEDRISKQIDSLEPPWDSFDEERDEYKPTRTKQKGRKGIYEYLHLMS